jgi:hypothetical protein
MNRYLQQLIEDLQRARISKQNAQNMSWSDDEEESISAAEVFVNGTPKPLSVITGIEKYTLPPPEKLTPSQCEILASELTDLLLFFHLVPDFPLSFPLHLQYAFLRNLWDNEYVELPFGENHIEFCNYNESECPFPGYCKICDEVAKYSQTFKEQEQ